MRGADNTSQRQRGKQKTERNPVKIIPKDSPRRKPVWLWVRSANSPEVKKLKDILRQHKLYTVCEEASCPNLGECFNHGMATFMIMGDVCTRRWRKY